MRRLDLTMNKDLQLTPRCFSDLSVLEELKLSWCDLTAVPRESSQLTALTSLNLLGNPIASGWQHLSLLALHTLKTDPTPAH